MKNLFRVGVSCLLLPLLLASCGGGSDSGESKDTSSSRQRALAGESEVQPPVLTATWTKLPNPNYAPPAGPYARAWTEMTWDTVRQQVVIYAGNGPTGYENDIWAYNATTTNWTVLSPNVFCPGNHGFDRPNGTDDSNFKYDPVNDMYWAFGNNSGYRCLSHATVRNAAAGSNTTTIVDPSLPTQAEGHYANWTVRVAGVDVRVTGSSDATKTLTLATPVNGLSAGSSYLLYATTGAGTWYFDKATSTWVGQNTPGGNTGPTPSGARIAPAVAYSDPAEAFVLFGGKVTGAADKTVWRLDVRTKLWTQLPLPAGPLPPHMRETLNSFVYDKQNDVFILFGGICTNDSTCPEYTYNGQTWAYHLPTNTWTAMNPPTSPSARAQHVMAYDEEHGVIVLTGGANGSGDLSDSWFYHYPSNRWVQLSPPTSPIARRLAQVAYDPLNRRTMMYGGQAVTGMSSEMWALKLTASTGAPAVALTAPSNGSSYTSPASIALSATASDADGTIALVEFFAGTSKIGEATAEPYALNWTNVAAGSYSLTARATDNAGLVSTSTPVTVTVSAPNQAPTVAISAPSNGTTYTAPAGFTISATAADSDGTVSKVEFYNGATKLGEDSSAPYSLNVSGLAAGTYSLTARATDNGGLVTTSTAVGITVTPPNNQLPTVSLTAPSSGTTFTAPASITLTASAGDSDGSIVRVEYFAGATKLGETTSAPHTLAWTSVPAGSYSLTARATDNAGASTTSTAVGVTVVPPSSGNSVNVALQSQGGVATASTTHSSGYPVASVNNGIRTAANWGNGGGWNDANANVFPDWVQVSFNGAKSINRIDVITLADNYSSGTQPTATTTFTQYGITAFEVQYWNGAAWATVPGGSITGNNLVWRTITFATVSTDRIRVLVNNGLYWHSRIVEIEAWTVEVPTGPQAPTVALTSPTSGSSFTAPATVTLGASAADADGSVTLVEFFAGATKVGEATAAPYVISWTGVAAGSYSLTARATDDAGQTTTSAAVNVTVNPPNEAPTVAITGPAGGSTYTAPAAFTFSANAADSDGSISKVEFYAGATKLGEDSSAPYSLNVTGLAAGSYALTARATDNTGAVTTSSPVNIMVNPAPNQAPTVAITGPAGGSSYTAPASFTFNAAAADSDGSIAKVEFYAGATKLGEDSSAPYSLNVTGLAAGSYALTAVATDNAGAVTTSGPVGITVNTAPNQAPTVAITAPSNGSTYTAPASFTFNATAADSDGTISKVEFYDGATKLGEDSSAPYSLNVSGLAAGSHTLTAVAADNGGGVTTSASVTITVNPPANQAPTVALTTPTGGASFTAPASITLTASAADSDGSVVLVEYFAGATKLGETTGAPHSFTWTSVPAGSYSLTARATDNSGATTSSAAVAVTVSPPSSGNAVNVALQSNGGVATASSVQSAGYPVASVNNGSRTAANWANGGGWNDATQNGFPDWVQVAFNGSKSINRVDVITLADNYAAGVQPTASTTFSLYGITAYEVQYWNGASWVAVPGGTVTGNNLVWRSFTFPAVTTDRIRVLVNNSLYWYSRIVEIEAWSEP